MVIKHIIIMSDLETKNDTGGTKIPVGEEAATVDHVSIILRDLACVGVEARLSSWPDLSFLLVLRLLLWADVYLLIPASRLQSAAAAAVFL